MFQILRQLQPYDRPEPHASLDLIHHEDLISIDNPPFLR